MMLTCHRRNIADIEFFHSGSFMLQLNNVIGRLIYNIPFTSADNFLTMTIIQWVFS